MNGIYLRRSDNNSIANNSITKNGAGICLSISTNNKFIGNNVTSNTNGVVLHDTSNNYFYLNNFVNNTHQLYIWTEEQVPNIWDNGEVGNFWSNYNGTDANGDGVGESPFIVDTEEATNITPWHSETLGNQQDNFPLMDWYVGQKLPLPTNVQPTNVQPSIEVYVIVFATLSTIISTGLLVYFKKRKR
jgi:parallel beta-helix repeat protein